MKDIRFGITQIPGSRNISQTWLIFG